MRCAIGIDVGGTKCAAGLVSLDDGRVIERKLRPTRPERDSEAVLADVIELVRSFQTEAKQLAVSPTSIGVGLCELVGVEGQILSDATIHWMGTPVAGRIEHATGLPVFVDADVRAAARAEAHFGAGRNLRCFLYVTVGTGISSCLVVNRKPFSGARGLTGTFASGNTLVPGEHGKLLWGPPLEQFASGPAIASRFRAASSGLAMAAPEILALAETGDPLAVPIVETAGRALGAASAQLVNALDPEAVVIGGGLGLAGGLFRRCVENALHEFVWSDLHRNIRLVSAKLGNDAGMVGAALSTKAPSPCPLPEGEGL
jgi:glucokinase